ncbi:MAG: hypothetical protein JSW23_05620 [Planctomycetota bacterium]|nr:MAG: hypothetical protein JSW23_05620 [Planctomycetota bacterium]
MVELVRGKFLPNAVFLFHDTGEGEVDEAIGGVVPFLKEYIAMNSKATAYVCEDYVCNQPVATTEELNKMLGGYSWGKRR